MKNPDFRDEKIQWKFFSFIDEKSNLNREKIMMIDFLEDLISDGEEEEDDEEEKVEDEVKV